MKGPMHDVAGHALALCAAALLGACGGSDSASYLIDGTGDHALTLFRDKSFLWSDGWDLQLVVTNQPDCQRRHALKRGGGDNFKLSVYRSGDGAYILKQGKRWYVTELRSCRLQQYEEAPPAPGEPVGAFDAKGGVLHFSPAATDVKAAPDDSPQDPAPLPGR